MADQLSLVTFPSHKIIRTSRKQLPLISDCHHFLARDISRGRGPAKFRYFREILQNSPKNTKYREIRQK